MNAEILAIGHELLMGETADTNSSFLATQLPSLGIQLRWVSIVGDDLAHLQDALSRAWQRSQVIITTGGLGPTMDDLTREAVAQLMGEEPFLDPDLQRTLEERFRTRSMTMAPNNLKQAMRIPSVTALPNDRGTAPGWWVEREGRILVTLPGPPGELEAMWEQHVAPRLRERAAGTVLLTRTLKTFGLPEATVDEMISPVQTGDNPYLGIYAKPEGIWVRLIARAASRAAAEALVQPVETQLRALLGPYLWGVDKESPQQQIDLLLRQKGFTLACMESCSGGLLASTITDVPGASDYFKGGAVTYSTEAKVALGVHPATLEQFGSVSPQTAEAMAQAICRRLAAAVGVSIPDLPGPSELEGRPVGEVHVGLAYPGGSHSVSARYPARVGSLVKHRAVTGALLELWRLLQRL